MEIKVYHTYSSDNLRFGTPGTVTFKDYSNGTEMVWSEPYTIEVPDNYTLGQNEGGDTLLFDGKGDYVPLQIDLNGVFFLANGPQYSDRLCFKAVRL